MINFYINSPIFSPAIKRSQGILLFLFLGSATSSVFAQSCAYGTPQVTCISPAPAVEGNSVSCNITTSGNIFRITGMTAGAIYRVSNCGSGFDTQITVFPMGGGTSLGYNDDNGIACSGTAASLDFTPPSDGTYDIKLTKWNCLTSGSAGTLTVMLEPIFNPCFNIVDIPFCDASTNVTIEDGNGIYDNASCGFSTPGEETIFSFTATTTGTYSVDLSAIASDGGYLDFMYKEASSGCSETGWNCIGDLNTTGNIGSIFLNAGVDYFILLDPEFTAGATCTFTISCPTGTFDPCANIGSITDCGSAVTTNIPSGTGAYDPPSASCSFSTPGKETIYSFTPSSSGNYSVDASAISGGFIDFFYKSASSGCGNNNWNCIAAENSAQTFGSFFLTKDTSYYILLDPEFTTGGSCTFDLTCITNAPSNDNVCNAIPLSEGNNGPYSNVNATVQSGEPAPPASGCDVTDGWCDSNLDNTIWFSFIAPASGRISISSTGFDTQLALWSATDCNNFSSFQLIAANDDGGPSASSLLDPVNCLIPGHLYYVQVDGHNGATGNAFIQFQSLSAADASFTGLATSYCSNDGFVLLSPATSGGQFSGPGITGNIFDPTKAKPGNDTITYTLYSCYSSSQVTTLNSSTVWYRDADNDGYGTRSDSVYACTKPAGYVSLAGDCNDNIAQINPGAEEVCNGVDDNCNGSTDEGVTITFYADKDHDGFGDNNDTIQACSLPSGYSTNNTDCNDSDATVNAPQLFFIDYDLDGYGSTLQGSVCASSPPLGYSSNSTDCDDSNALINPNAIEVCNNADDNCNGKTDEGVTTTFYQDNDTDGYGNDTVQIQACSAPDGYVITGGDCNDQDSNVHPGAQEICNGIDDNCNGSTDENGNTVFYADVDGDGFGNPKDSVIGCSPPPLYVSNNTDCNDQSANVHPGAQEICNGIDDNCNGKTDEGVKTVFYQDKDGDGYGNDSVQTKACSVPAGYSATGGDCNDQNANVHPGAEEICNGIDDNCNGSTDETGNTVFYADRDGDGFGNPADSVTGCSPPPLYVSDNTDCDDQDPNVHPGAPEICNGLDDNCNGKTDEGVIITFYQDNDGDGYGNDSVQTQACSAPAGYVVTGGDCNDQDSSVHPGAEEICNGIDDNCNGVKDENGQTTFYADLDGDGYGNPNDSLVTCFAPPQYVSNNGDCNDQDASVHALQPYYVDADSDGFGSNTLMLICASSPPSGFSSNNADCDDENSSVNPNALEICNGIDDNCNGNKDEGVLSVFYTDADGDGFGNPADSTQSCSAPPGFVSNNKDCDDSNPLINPDAIEVCNGIDDNCNNQIDENTLDAQIVANGPTEFCAPGSVQLQASPSGSQYLYTWVRDTTILINQTTNRSRNAKETGNYFAIVTNGMCSDTSNIIQVIEDPKPSSSITPADSISQCGAVPVTLTAVTDIGISYQWKRNGDNVSGATDNTYTSTTSGSYKVAVTSAQGCKNTSKATTISRLVGPKKAIIQILNSGNLDLCLGQVRLKTSGSPAYSYQWFKDDTAIDGATVRNFIPKSPGSYLVQVSLISDGCDKQSDPVTVISSCKESLPQFTSDGNLLVYPNPSDGNFYVQLNLNEMENNNKVVLQVLNILGQAAYNKELPLLNGKLSTEIKLDHTWSSGQYLVRIIANDKVLTRRITIQQ